MPPKPPPKARKEGKRAEDSGIGGAAGGEEEEERREADEPAQPLGAHRLEEEEEPEPVPVQPPPPQLPVPPPLLPLPPFQPLQQPLQQPGQIPVIMAAAAAPGAVQGGQLAAIAPFTGEPTADIEIWVTMLDSSATSFRWSDETTAAAAKSKMKDAAAAWMHSERLQERRYPNWNDAPLVDVPAAGNVPAVVGRPLDNMRTALLKRFAPPTGSVAAVRAIINLKQESSESIDQFHDRVVIAMDRKNTHIPREDRNGVVYQAQLQRDIFTFLAGGMLEEHRSRVFGLPTPPETVPDMLVAARNSEAVAHEEKKRRSANDIAVREIAAVATSPAPATSTEDTVTGNQEDVRVFVEAFHRAFGRGQGGQGGGAAKKKNKNKKNKKDAGSLLCYNCRGTGHFARNCPHPPTKSGGGSSGNSSSGN